MKKKRICFYYINQIKNIAIFLKFNLDICKDVKIGIVGRIKGISGGQKKRLSFASEVYFLKDFIH